MFANSTPRKPVAPIMTEVSKIANTINLPVSQEIGQGLQTVYQVNLWLSPAQKALD